MPCNDNVKAEYWYIIFCSTKDAEPVEEFTSTVPSANLASV